MAKTINHKILTITLLFVISSSFLTALPFSAQAQSLSGNIIKRVQGPIEASGSDGSYGQSWSLQVDTSNYSVATGQLQVLRISTNTGADDAGPPTITNVVQTNATWNQAVTSNNKAQVAIYYSYISSNSSVSNITVNLQNQVGYSGCAAIVYSVYSGVASNPLDKWATNSGSSIQNSIITSGTTPQTSTDAELAISVFGSNYPLTTPAVNGTLLDKFSISGVAIGCVENVSVPQGYVSQGLNITTTYSWASAIATFKAQLPTYTNLTVSSTVANTTQTFNATFTDATALNPNGRWQFGTNNTGTWNWTAPANFTTTPETETQSLILNSTVGATITYMWNFSNNAGSYSSTGPQNIITTDAPPSYLQYAAMPIQQGYPCNFTSKWTDNLALSGWIFNSNTTGTSTNTTWTAFTTTPDWANTTQTLPNIDGANVVFQWYANDSANNWATTGPITLKIVNSLQPWYSNITYSSSAPSSAATFSVQWQGVNGLSGFIFSINTTGSWVNFSYARLYNNPDFAITLTSLPSTENTVVGFRWYANDTNNNWGDTGIQTLTTSASGAGSSGSGSSYYNIQPTTTTYIPSATTEATTTSMDNTAFLGGAAIIIISIFTVLAYQGTRKRVKKASGAWT